MKYPVIDYNSNVSKHSHTYFFDEKAFLNDLDNKFFNQTNDCIDDLNDDSNDTSSISPHIFIHYPPIDTFGNNPPRLKYSKYYNSPKMYFWTIDQMVILFLQKVDLHIIILVRLRLGKKIFILSESKFVFGLYMLSIHHLIYQASFLRTYHFKTIIIITNKILNYLYDLYDNIWMRE